VLNACVENKVKKIIFASFGGSVYEKCNAFAFKKDVKIHHAIAKNSVENCINFYSIVLWLELHYFKI
jgi:nucleoside-diphosphate-sugar epimerase